MKGLIRVYLPFAKGMVKEFMAYGINAYVYIFGNMLQTAVLIYIWKAVFDSSQQSVIKNFSFNDMIFYVVMSMVTGMLVGNDVHWSVGRDVQTGDIAMNLIKPVNYQLRQYFGSLGFVFVNLVFIFLPMWSLLIAYTLFTGQALPTLLTLGLYFVSAFLSSMIMFAMNYMFGLAAFYVEYIFGFIFAKEALVRLLSGELIPLVFFPAALLGVLKYLPFAGIVYTPVMIYLGKYSAGQIIEAIIIQLVWVIVLMVCTQLLWRRAIKRLSILGG